MKQAVIVLVSLSILGHACSKSTSPTQPADRDRPQIAWTVPAANAELRDLNGPVQATFVIPDIRPSSVNATTFWIDGKPGTVSYDNGTASFLPTTPFDHKATYTAHLAATITDNAGNTLNEEYTWSFTTRDWDLMPITYRTFGQDGVDVFASALTPCTDGRLVCAGAIGGTDVYLAKVDTAAVLLWERTIDLGGIDRAVSVTEATDGGFVISGVTGASGTDGVLVKTNGTGVVLWQKTLAATTLAGALVASDGGILAYGSNPYPYIEKFTANGTSQWVASASGEHITGLCQLPDGGYLYATTSLNHLNSHNLCAGKLTATGTHEWFSTLLTTSYYPIFSSAAISKSPDGNYVVLGGSTDGYVDGVAVKVNAQGTVLWQYRPTGYNGSFTTGCPFRDGIIAVTTYDENSWGGPLVFLNAAGQNSNSWSPQTWRPAGLNTALWVHASVPRGSSELVVAGASAHTKSGPRQLLFVRLRWM